MNIVRPIDRKYVAAISGSGQQLVVRIEGERIDDVFVRSPYSRGRTVRSDPYTSEPPLAPPPGDGKCADRLPGSGVMTIPGFVDRPWSEPDSLPC